MLKAFRQIPQNDKRYQKVVKMHKISMITAGSLLVVSIVLGGLGIHELKLEKVEKYNSLVQQQINYRQKKNYKKEEKAYKEAIKIIPDSLESYYQNALAIYEKGDYKECLDFISYDIELNEKVNMLQKEMQMLCMLKHVVILNWETINKQLKVMSSYLGMEVRIICIIGIMQ